MATHAPQRPRAQRQTTVSGGTVALQCVASMAGTLVGESLGTTLTARLAAGALGALIGAFLTAPGRQRRRRIVAVALLLALLDALRRARGALAAERPRAWLPANWMAVGATAVVGFGAGSGVTTALGGWEEERAAVLVAVPEVRGEPSDAAVSTLGEAGLRATVAREPSEAVAEGSATRTDPAAGADVSENALVTLYVSSGPPGDAVTVPEVTGLDRRAAATVLRDAGLRPRAAREASDAIAPGLAVRTVPPAGEQVDVDSRVRLFLSAGPAARPVAVPPVRGEPEAAALTLLREAGLRPTVAREPSEAVEEGSATRTDPPAGTEVARRTPVTLYVSSGPPPAGVVVPDVTGSTREEAFAVLSDAGLSPEGTAETSSVAVAGTVIRTDPAAGTQVAEDAPVTVVVSSGPPPLVVPKLAGLPVETAFWRLDQVDLRGERVIAGSRTVQGGVVIGSEPPAGTVVARGESVRVLISCGRDPCIE